MTKPAVAYLRVSTDGQTVETQKFKITQYATEHDYEIIDWFIDEAKSGALEDRPDLIRLKEWVTHNEGGSIIFVNNDRLARDLYIFYTAKHLFDEWGMDVHYLNFTPTGNLAMDEFLLGSLANFAQLERYMIFERFEGGRQRKISEQKKAWGGTPRYGYKLRIIPISRDKNYYYLEDNEEESSNVRYIYKLFLNGCIVVQEICRKLAEKGIKTRSGSLKWAPTTIRGILKDPIYYGEYHYGKTKTVGVGNRKREVPRAEEEQIIVQVPAIIGKDDFDHVQEIINYYKARRNPKQNNKGKNLLTGLIRCGKCHYRYTGWRRSSTKIEDKWFYYRCNSINQYDPENKSPSCGNPPIMGYQVEEIVWNEMVKLIIKIAIKKENIWKNTSKKQLEYFRNKLSNEYSIIQDAINKNLKKQNELMDYIGVFSKEQISDKQNELIKAKKELDHQLKDIISKSVLLTYNGENTASIPDLDIDVIKNPTFEKKREIILKYLKEVIVLPIQPTRILIVFSIPIKPIESIVTRDKDSGDHVRCYKEFTIKKIVKNPKLSYKHLLGKFP